MLDISANEDFTKNKIINYNIEYCVIVPEFILNYFLKKSNFNFLNINIERKNNDELEFDYILFNNIPVNKDSSSNYCLNNTYDKKMINILNSNNILDNISDCSKKNKEAKKIKKEKMKPKN